MTADEFRALFNRVKRAGELLMIAQAPSGDLGIAVGLNGDQLILHGGRELPLAKVRDHPLHDDMLLELEQAA